MAQTLRPSRPVDCIEWLQAREYLLKGQCGGSPFVILGLYWDNGNGNYYLGLGFGVQGLGFPGYLGGNGAKSLEFL